MEKQFFIIFILISLLVLKLDAQNLITNGSFSNGTNNWMFTFGNGAAGSWATTIVSGDTVAMITSTTLSTAPSNIQLLQRNITLSRDSAYHLTFRAKASLYDNQIKLSLGLDVSPDSTYFSQTFTLSTSWQTYNLSFISSASWFPVTNPSNHQLAVQCGINPGNVYIDDIQLTKSTVTHTNKPSTFVPRTNFPNSRLDPKDVVFHCAGQTDFTSFTNYQNALSSSHCPMAFMTYYTLSTLNSTWGSDLKKKLNNYPQWILPQIGLTLIANNAPYTDDINNGIYDTQIDNFVQGIKDLNRPVYIRIGYECNGSSNAYQPTSYINAFIRITNKLRAANVEAATVWDLVVSGVTSDNISDYYPGDQYVDWVGLNLFSASAIGSSGSMQILNFATTKNKPVMIGESTPRYVGVLDGQTSWNNWFDPYFKFIANNPGIKMFCYINRNWADYTKWADWGDSQLQDNLLVAANYDEEMSSKLYFHGTVESVTRSILSSAISTPVQSVLVPKLNIIYRDGFLYFSGFDNKNTLVEIYNLSGILQMKCKLSYESVNVKALNNGIYIIKINGLGSKAIQILNRSQKFY